MLLIIKIQVIAVLVLSKVEHYRNVYTLNDSIIFIFIVNFDKAGKLLIVKPYQITYHLKKV